MKDSLRRKFSKSNNTGSNEPAEKAPINKSPWLDEDAERENSLSAFRQQLKLSRTQNGRSSFESVMESAGDEPNHPYPTPPRIELPPEIGSDNERLSTGAQTPSRRRRKTITKVPGTFVLVDVPPPVPKDKSVPGSPMLAPGYFNQKPLPSPSLLSHSAITTTLDQEPEMSPPISDSPVTSFVFSTVQVVAEQLPVTAPERPMEKIPPPVLKFSPINTLAQQEPVAPERLPKAIIIPPTHSVSLVNTTLDRRPIEVQLPLPPPPPPQVQPIIPPSHSLSPVTTTLDRSPAQSKVPLPSSHSLSSVATTLDRYPIEAQLPAQPQPVSPPTPVFQAASSPSLPAYKSALPTRPVHKRNQSSQPGLIVSTSTNPCRFTPITPTEENFSGKVVVLTSGTSLVGQLLVRKFHSVGAKVIFGDTSPSASQALINSLPPPHTVHYNRCNTRKYRDILELFNYAVQMYGRVDHAIFGIGDDGGQSGLIGDCERGWFDHTNQTAKVALDELQIDHTEEVEGNITSSTRFARIALAYLQFTPPMAKGSLPTRHPEESLSAYNARAKSRSLTFITSTAGFKEMPGLPVYSATQHAMIGLVRSLSGSLDPEIDKVRVNAVVTNMMVPRINPEIDGKSSITIPPDMPDDVCKVVAGVVAGIPYDQQESMTKQGLWYEDSIGRMGDRYLHGRLLYMVGSECWDIEEGLNKSERTWLGAKPAEVLKENMIGIDRGKQWMLDC